MEDIIETECNEKINEKNRNLKVQENIEVQQKTMGARRMEEKEKLILGICDDEELIHKRVERILGGYEAGRTCQLTLRHFYSGQELLEFEGEMDALLLDIDMPEMDGIEAAHHLNKRGITYKIIMLTSKVERFKETFQIGAFRFVTKPIMEDELFRAIDDVRERMIGRKEMILYSNRAQVSIQQQDILYIMADRTRTIVFTKNTSYQSEQSLEQWEQELEKKMFFRTHRSYIVNLGKIELLDKEAILVSGEKIPVSKRKRREVEAAYGAYDTRYR